MTDKYAKQDRGNLSAYEEYFSGMDASMQQKIALTTAHFPSRGRIADMGSGSGSGTFDLARLYNGLELVGVDINPVTVEYSKNHYQAGNLSFTVGDIAENVFPAASLDAILDSSVLHHVTSFNNYDIKQIDKTVANQVNQLRPGGVLIIRDFVVPDEEGKLVYLDLPNNDGAAEGEIPELSTAVLFEVFARDFRSSLNMSAGVPFRRVDSPRVNFSRFEVTMRAAAEFVLRKDYRDHWAPELIEEYTYCSQTDFERLFQANGLRIVVSMPLWNPWIVENRFAGKFYLSDTKGQPLHFPPTNFLIVGEKIDTQAGYRILEGAPSKTEPGFLQLKAYRDKRTNQVYELAERPNQTIDLLPWFEAPNGQIFILAKKDFPRPVINAAGKYRHLNRANYSGYLTEPLSAIVNHRETEESREIAEILEERAEIAATDIVEVSQPVFYFTSPGGIDEQVESFLVRINEWGDKPHKIENYTPFADAGVVRELDALQVLRASHVGGMFDARLEINIYRLLRFLNRPAGSWIGAAITPDLQKLPDNINVAETLPTDRFEAFEEVELTDNKFLSLVRTEFAEYDPFGSQISAADFEYVVPRVLSKNTVAAIPFVRTADGVFAGIEFRDLPAPQRFTGSSRLACVPAWRLPFEIDHKFDLPEFLDNRFFADFQVSIKRTWELGGSYFTSPGITPEVVYPMAVELDAESLGQTDLSFLRLEALIAQVDKIQDAHLIILLNRLDHALLNTSK